MNEGIEKQKSGKEILKDLEAEGKYLFHGSPIPDIKIFEPRQSTHVPDMTKPEESILDGKPAVSASPHSELAIFRAVINSKNVKMGMSGFGTDGTKLKYNVSSKEVLNNVKGKGGFVYVFTRSDFVPYNRDGEPEDVEMEWRSYKEVEPIQVIEVSSDDLPDENEIEIK